MHDATFAQKYAVNIHMLQCSMFMHMPLYYHKKNEANFNKKKIIVAGVTCDFGAVMMPKSSFKIFKKIWSSFLFL